MSFGFIKLNIFSRSEGREQISEIVKNNVYLSNFPRAPLPSHVVEEQHSALVSSCVDLKELIE